MSWVNLLFAHFRVDAQELAAMLPPGLQLDLFDGQAFVGIVPFVMDNVGIRRWPTPAPWARFCELNVRTYVVASGRPGVWFFSLDAASRVAVEGARRLFNLPYFNADMACQTIGKRVVYASTRTDRRAGPGGFRAQWEPTSPVRTAAAGTLEHWLTERYCLYSRDPRGQLHRAQVHHRQWPLCDATAEIEHNSVCDAHGIRLSAPREPLLLHCVQGIDVVGWWTTPVDQDTPT